MTTKINPAPHAACAVNRHIPFVHVVDVEASLDFYTLLGFVPERVLKDASGHAFWALAKSAKAEIMFARASGPIDSEQQAVLFYMYSEDVVGLRRHLLENGVRDGGTYLGVKNPDDGPRMVFEIARPHYMPEGEFRISDPDGYCILVGRLG